MNRKTIYLEIDTHDDNIINYAAIGETQNGKFNGVVYGYVGGGQYDDWYIFQDKFLPTNIKDEFIDQDTSSKWFEQLCPNLVTDISELHSSSKYTYLDTTDNLLHFKPLASNFSKDIKWNGKVFTNDSAFEPITFGSNAFDKEIDFWDYDELKKILNSKIEHKNSHIEIDKKYLTIDIDTGSQEVKDNLVKNTKNKNLKDYVLSYDTKEQIFFHTKESILDIIKKMDVNFLAKIKNQEWADFANKNLDKLSIEVMHKLNPNAQKYFVSLAEFIYDEIQNLDLKVLEEKQLIDSFICELEFDYDFNGYNDFDISIYTIIADDRIEPDISEEHYKILDSFIKQIQEKVQTLNLTDEEKELCNDAQVGFIMHKLKENSIALYDIYKEWKNDNKLVLPQIFISKQTSNQDEEPTSNKTLKIKG